MSAHQPNFFNKHYNKKHNHLFHYKKSTTATTARLLGGKSQGVIDILADKNAVVKTILDFFSV
jgi:hypothetical protein